MAKEASFGRASSAAPLLLLLVFTCSAADPQPPAPTTTDFIKTSCTATTYPRLCYNSLSTYADSINTDPKLLARTAVNVTLGSARSMHRFMKKLGKVSGLKRREAVAVADCVESVASAVDELRMSVEELGRVGGSDFHGRMGDVETWVSAAMTDEDTCMEGFAGRVMNGRVKRLVRKRVMKLYDLTSIALAFVNSYASSPGVSP